ncbi:hypothetical protein VE04_06820 [Pseudogymnoascus sp. 24MN13]|nr:hypothetical protein VE04_06820 [Pseudogymnoascus sp. 24MN13]
MGHLVTLATCSLNQWALDFEGNAQRILQSIKEAKAGGASLRIGPELEITGYGCLDHFLESDTDMHSWESLVMILKDPICEDILLDIGMPVMHKNVRYNARILSLNKEILLIRPKLSLANDGNYREMRYFSPWKGERIVEDFYLPRSVQKLTGQKKCRIGDALISTLDSCMSNETCEELFTPISPALGAGLDGSEITLNSSGSHHELRKLHTRIDLIRQETLKSGGVYLYSNQQGCDGDRLYYDGCAMIIINGRIVAQGSQFSLNDVETVIATVESKMFAAIDPKSLEPFIYQAVLERKNPQVIKDLLRIVGEPSDSKWLPSSPQDIASRLFHTAYLGMSENSSKDTRSRAKALAKGIGAYHLDLNIDTVYYAVTTLFTAVTSYTPKFKMFGGTPASNLALQNIQARLRMVLSYLFAQLLPTVRGRNKNNPENQNPGGLLVLGSANIDESLRGYLTKYDCSSADINPIGGIAKQDLKRFILWAATNFDLPILHDFISAPPTAELEPITADYVQSDEADMGMTYDELTIYGRMRKVDKLGPYGMWSKLVHQWSDKLSPQEIYTKVRWFFWNYGINRHKMTTLTPSYHAEQYSPDDNRFDLRPFLYPSWFGFKVIEKKLAAMGENGTKVADAEERKSL